MPKGEQQQPFVSFLVSYFHKQTPTYVCIGVLGCNKKLLFTPHQAFEKQNAHVKAVISIAVAIKI